MSIQDKMLLTHMKEMFPNTGIRILIREIYKIREYVNVHRNSK